MPLGIDPTVDYAFKKLFGDPENSDLLIHLLNAVLKPDSPIVDVQMLNPFNEKEFAEAKLTVLDIKARDASGAWYNVEMQSSAVGVLRRRLPYYNSLLFANQLSEGDGYELLAAAITVCFLNGVLFPDVEAPHLAFTLCDLPRKLQLTDCLQIHTIELPKYNFEEGSLATADPLEQWAFFLSHAAEFEAAELKRMLPDRAYVKATGVMEMIGSTPQQREFYEARRKAELDYKSFAAAAAQEARREGEARGEALGEARGKALGEARGKALGEIQGHKLGLVKHIHFLQEILQQPITPESDLMALELKGLNELCIELQRRVTGR